MNKSANFLTVLLGFLIFLSINPLTAFAQKKCKNTGEVQKFTFQNTTGKAIEIKPLDDNCKEGTGKLLDVGGQVGGNSYTGVVFRIYELATGKLISEIALEKSREIYNIEAIKKEISPANKINPADGFLKAANEIRATKNLPPVQLDERLNNACRFFADLMAKADKGPAHTASEIGMEKSYQDRNKPAQRFAFYGWDKKNTDTFEVTALDSVDEYNLLGKHFAELWAYSKTHYKPFLDKNSVKYNRIGFSVAKAERGENRYYACAVFAKE